MKKILALAVLLLFVGGLLFAHANKPWPAPEKAKKRKNPVAATEESLRRGAGLYRSQCEICHGHEGKGDGPWVEKLPVKPADLTDVPMMSEMTDGEIFWKISTGRDEMPRFELQLNEEERWHLVNFVRSLVRKKPAAGAQHVH